ncbi:MAG: DUF4230 domain-containing protein [Lachnospiraceae bacterium]|nr:DUF4230 domain-containing protein [Lachnospiraceae bacterium]
MREMPDYLDEIREAAKEGAREGVRESFREGAGDGRIRRHGGGIGAGILGSLLGKLLAVVLAAALIAAAIHYLNPFPKLKEQLAFDNKAEEHDLVLEDDGFLGYTAADFAEAVLGDQSKLCKLEVLEQKVTDVTTLTDTGLANIKIFTKSQLITYHGTAIYTVDLSGLNKSDFTLDEEEKTLTLTIPHAALEPINIQSSDIEFGDVEKGLLAMGEIKLPPEKIAEVQTEAQEKMTAKLLEDNVAAAADRFAKLVVWELFQPVINGVDKGYSLVVAFED